MRRDPEAAHSTQVAPVDRGLLSAVSATGISGPAGVACALAVRLVAVSGPSRIEFENWMIDLAEQSRLQRLLRIPQPERLTACVREPSLGKAWWRTWQLLSANHRRALYDGLGRLAEHAADPSRVEEALAARSVLRRFHYKELDAMEAELHPGRSARGLHTDLLEVAADREPILRALLGATDTVRRRLAPRDSDPRALAQRLKQLRRELQLLAQALEGSISGLPGENLDNAWRNAYSQVGPHWRLAITRVLYSRGAYATLRQLRRWDGEELELSDLDRYLAA